MPEDIRGMMDWAERNSYENYQSCEIERLYKTLTNTEKELTLLNAIIFDVLNLPSNLKTDILKDHLKSIGNYYKMYLEHEKFTNAGGVIRALLNISDEIPN